MFTLAIMLYEMKDYFDCRSSHFPTNNEMSESSFLIIRLKKVTLG